VYVRIDQPGKYGGIVEIADVRTGWNLRGRNNRLYLLALHQDCGRPNSLLRDHPAGDESLQAHGVNRRPAKRCSSEAEPIAAASLFQPAIIKNSS